MLRVRRRKESKAETGNCLFISYSRADGAFVRALFDALIARGINAWVDWEDIPPSAEWMTEIRRGIDAADAFAFVLSPDSLASPVCSEELGHAVTAGKRLIPLVRGEVKPEQAHEALRKLNWIFARSDQELPTAVDRFVEALTTDLDKLRMHARILVRAREWIAREHDRSFLLRGRDLQEAEVWLASLDARGPLPSALHSEYVLASQQAEREEGERWKRLYEESLARQLAAQSQLLVDQRGTALPLAALLAVEAAKRSPSLETDQALRKTLRLMPARHRETTARPFDRCFWSDGADRVAVVSGDAIEVRTLDTDQLLCRIATGGDVPERGLHASPVVMSRDGERVVAIVGMSVCAWRVADGGLISRHECDAPARSLALNGDATRVAVVTDRPQTLVIDVDAGQVTVTLQHDAPMLNVSMHPETREVAVWGQTTAEIWDVGNQVRIASIPHSGAATVTMRYSPTGEYLALLQRMTFELNVFHVPTRRLLFAEKRHVAIAFDARDRFFAIASPEWDIGVYNLPKCERMFRMMHDNSVWQVAFSPDGTRLSSVSKDGTVRVWEVEREGREVARLVRDGVGPRQAVFSQDGLRLFLLNEDSVEMHDARGLVEWRLLDVQSPVFAVDAGAETGQLAFGCRNGTFALVGYGGTGGLDVIHHVPGRNAMGEQVTDVACVGGNARMLLKRSFGSYHVLDLASRKSDEGFLALQAATAEVCRAGAVVVLTGQGDEIVKWDGDVMARRKTDRPVTALAFAESGTAIGVHLEDGTVIVYDGELANERLRIAASSGRRLQLDHDGTLLALWDADDASSRVRIVDGGTGAPVAEWALPSRINDLRFDPRGGRVVLALEDKSVQVWDARAGVALAVFRHEAAAVTACFLGDDGMVASGGWDGTVRIWPWNANMLIGAACLRLDRNLTEAEWAQYLPGEPYRLTCPLSPASTLPRS